MGYYNQNNYTSVPYPSSAYPDATVKSGGCGVCCASMVVEELTGKKWPPNQSAAYSIAVGARVSGGTDMKRLAACISKDFGLCHQTTSNIDILMEHLSKGMAIVNVGGNRAGYVGLFSDSGHFITAAGMKAGKMVIHDPGYYGGKFSKAGRAGKVAISGNEIYVDPALLDKDAENRSPKYYLFYKEDNDMDTLITRIANIAGLSETDTIKALGVLAKFANITEDAWEKDGVDYLIDAGLLTSPRDGRELVEFGELGVILKRLQESIRK